MNYLNRIIIFFQLLWAMPMTAQNACLVTQIDGANCGCIKIEDLNGLGIENINSIKNLGQFFQVFPQEIWPLKNEDIPPVLGVYVFENNNVFFRPRFPFREGKSYVLVVKNEIENVFIIDVPEGVEKKSTELITVYPTGPNVPSNLLKIYMEFSAPMSLENPYPYVRLLEENGEEVSVPFLEIEPPLWDKEQKRLTLWFDPGRIKSGLSPNVKLGPPLESGKEYTLHISEEWKDAFGQPIHAGAGKKWLTFAPDVEQPNPETWRISKPSAGTKDPLMVHLFEALDYGVLKNGLGVKSDEGAILQGEIIVSGGEKVWEFIPQEKWKVGNYTILLSKNLEDLAGNNLERPFDKSLTKGVNTEPVLKLEFNLPLQK